MERESEGEEGQELRDGAGDEHEHVTVDLNLRYQASR